MVDVMCCLDTNSMLIGFGQKRLYHAFGFLEGFRPTSPAARGSGPLKGHNFLSDRDRALEPGCVCHDVVIAVRLVGL